MMINTIQEVIRSKIYDACTRKGIDRNDIVIDDNFNLVESGLYDSIGLLEFLISVQEELGVDVDISDLDPEEFTIHGNLVNLLLQHTPEKKPGV